MRLGCNEGQQFESAWKSWLRIFNLKHSALLALERQVFASVRLVIANSKMVAEEIVRLAQFSRIEDSHCAQRHR